MTHPREAWKWISLGGRKSAEEAQVDPRCGIKAEQVCGFSQVFPRIRYPCRESWIGMNRGSGTDENTIDNWV